MDRIQTRLAAGLKYLDAERSFRILSASKSVLNGIGAPRDLVEHRSRAAESLRFSFQAAFFSYGCMAAEGTRGMAYALWPEQQSDIDCVFRRRTSDGSFVYEAVQLKEWPAVETAPRLQELLEALPARYRDNSDLRVGIYLNREATTPLSSLAIPSAAIGGLWFYGLSGDRLNQGFLCGDLLRNSKAVYTFYLPRIPSSLSELPHSAEAEN